MFEFLAQNYVTILVGAAVLAIFVAVIMSLVKKKKSGGGSCSCGCSGCPNSSLCHKGQ